MSQYNHNKIEKKWQKIWQSKKVFSAKDFAKKGKKSVLVEFPYPSGAGLHMGHLRPYVAADVYSRFQRLNGKETLFPIGWDAFGLPAENYAIKMGVHPSKSTAQNIKNAKKQIQSWGLSFDWSREINTTDPEYYKWTQWIFLQFYKAGLAYEATGLINWCPKDKTGLANEEVIDGKCDRCGTPVEKKELRQWYLKITEYAQKLLDGLKQLPEWPDAVKLQQENWIGKSIGAEIEFKISDEWKVGNGNKPNFLILHGYKGHANRNFIPWLKTELENQGYLVNSPQLPNTDHPKEAEQVKFVLENCDINSNTVIVGHSLGGILAMKVLQKYNKPVKGLVLIAPAIEPKFNKYDSRPFWNDFSWDDLDYTKLQQLSSVRKVLSDKAEAHREEYLKYLSQKINADLISVNAHKEHFCGLEEPHILSSLSTSIKVFTTRPDTIFGATYVVLAPENPLIGNLKSKILNWPEVEKYINLAKSKSERQRSEEADKEKTGVELKGVKAINPANNKELPVWIADYVLSGYGTGSIMAVPAHDERDFAFAKKFKLPIKKVILSHQKSDTEGPTSEYGTLADSGKFSGLASQEAMPKMAEAFGKSKIQFKLRDWVFSRQRYWGEPIPIIHCPDCGIVPVPEKDLPVKLPPVKKYEPTGTGESPLAAITKWVNVKCPNCKSPAKRETNTMPQWAGSSWYWLRYADPRNKKTFADKKKLKYWTPVDVYFGGMEHTTLHLLYSRFWNLFLYDQKLVTVKEPYTKRVPHGIILGPDGEKMSKSRGNVVNPDDVVKEHGADTLRMYELFLGPHEATISWSDKGVIGVRRFLDRLWYWINQVNLQDKNLKSDSEKTERLINKLIKKVTEDIQDFRFNTAISSFMEFHNSVKDEPITKETLKKLLIILYPFAPHIVEELNLILGGKKSVQLESWPKFDSAKIKESMVEIVVQINGKFKSKLTVPSGSSQDSVQAEAMNLESVKKSVDSKSIKRVIYVQNRLVNLVI